MQWLQDSIADYVQGLSPAEYQLQMAVLVGLMGFLLYRVFRAHQRYRFISDTPTSRIASAAQGYVELQGLGELMPGATNYSPFSNRRCLWYQCTIEKRQHIHDSNNSHWIVISDQISDQLFHLHDDSGVCVIDPEGALVIPSQQHTWYGNSAQARYRGALHSTWFSRYVGFGKYRFSEKLIGVADALYVIGAFETRQNPLPADRFNDQVAALIDNWRANPHKHLREFDRNGNGKIQQQEWLPIRRRAEAIIRARQPDTLYHLLRKPREDSLPYVISALAEQTLLAKKRRQVILQLALFFALLYVLISAFNAYTLDNTI